MKILYIDFLGKFCLFPVKGFSGIFVAVFFFILQTGTLLLAESFGLGFPTLCDFPKMKKENKQKHNKK